MIYSGELLTGAFISRENRFRAGVMVDGKEFKAHVPNSGRMLELLVKGAPVVLRKAKNPERKTPYDLLQVKHKGHWVGIDSRLPPRMCQEALEKGLLPDLAEWQVVRKEPAFASGRADLLLKKDEAVLYVETKSVNLVIDGLACFPDAPTIRGTRHVRELAEHVKQGGNAAVVFIVQRPDALAVRPYHEADPEFATACREALQTGLPFLAVSCSTTISSLSPLQSIPVHID